MSAQARDLIVLAIIGIIAGFLASLLVGTGGGLLFYLVIGVIGAFIGSYLVGALGLSFGIGNPFASMIVTATIGAVVLLLIAQLVAG